MILDSVLINHPRGHLYSKVDILLEYGPLQIDPKLGFYVNSKSYSKKDFDKVFLDFAVFGTLDTACMRQASL